MRHFIISIIILITCFASVYGQSVKIYMKNGEKNEFNVNDIDSLVFYENEAASEGDDSPHIPDDVLESMIRGSLLSAQEYMLRFISSQLALESVPLSLAEGKRMVDFSDYYDNTWDDGFQVISACNQLINNLSDLSAERKFGNYLTEFRTMKAFTYYNVAQLWHNIPLIKEYDPMISYYRQAHIEEVLSYIEEELKSCIESADDEKSILFNNDFRYMLLAEVYLYDKQYVEAAEAISQIKDTNILFSYNLSDFDSRATDAHYAQLGYDNNIVIYNSKKLELMTRECHNQSEDLVSGWKETGFGYGYWAALKRLDAAKEEILCEVYDYLMPIPDKELYMNPYMIQNPRY